MKINTVTYLAPYITLVAGIIVAYLTYKNQLRLKSFEIFLKRREEVLTDIEKEIKKLQEISLELDSNGEKTNLKKFLKGYFHDSLVLYQKMRGANFHEVFVENYWLISNEMIGKGEITEEEFKSWIGRLLNMLSAIYGIGHVKINSEIEILTFPWHLRVFRKGKVFYENFKMKRQNKKMERQSKNEKVG